MPPQTYDTQDLRTLLQDTADTTGDLAEFRQRLETRVAATENSAVDDSPTVADELVVIPFDQEQRRWWSSRKAQLFTGALLAACIAAVALVVALVPWNTAPTPPAEPTPVVLPTPDPSVTVPADMRGTFEPGTLPLRNFAGVGPVRRLDLGHLVTVPHHEYTLMITCPVKHEFTLAGISGSNCSGSNDPFGLGLPGARRYVHLVVGPEVSWTLLLILEPVPDSNASGTDGMGGRHPEVAARQQVRSEGRNGWFRSGHGDATLPVPAIARGRRAIALDLTCTGSGVHVSGGVLEPESYYTNQCWRGYVYQWLNPKLRPPAVLTVRASPSTRWVISFGRP